MSGASENEARPFGGEHSPGRASTGASMCVACKEGVPRSLVWGTTDTYVHNYGGNPGHRRALHVDAR